MMFFRPCVCILRVFFAAYMLLSAVSLRAEEPEMCIDSQLKAYYKACRAKFPSPDVPLMCDTLLARADEIGDLNMQGWTLIMLVDHAFKTNDKEALIEGVERVKQFSVANGKSKFLRFYYLPGITRLVPYYIKHNQTNSAVYETCRILAEAQQDNYLPAVANCYRVLAEIYFSQANYHLAYENFKMLIALCEQHAIYERPVPSHYAALAECALYLNMPDSVALILDRADIYDVSSPHPRYLLDRVRVLYDLKRGDLQSARNHLEELKVLFDTNRGLKPYRSGLELLRTEYCRAAGQYAKALQIASTIDTNTLRLPLSQKFAVDKLLGELYSALGDHNHAATHFRNYTIALDSIREQEMRMASNDFYGILEVVRLQNEKKELLLDMQHKRLRNTYTMLFSVLGLFLLGILIYVRVVRFNRRLKSSEATIVAQNVFLQSSGEELRYAKERAEQANRMKSDFIQNMSHEVRTPLNSIVGFSQILVSQFRDRPDTKEYAAIIESSSRTLLCLIDDVLDLSFLDRTEELPREDICEMNVCCQDCIDKIQPRLRPGVFVALTASSEKISVRTNSKRIMQVIIHLLDNAAKFTETGGITLCYECLHQERLLRFTVTDTGPGIPIEHQDAVFERFVKLDEFTSGTGLGLPICRIIAARLGGSLHVDTSYTFGCRMIFEVSYEIPKDN